MVLSVNDKKPVIGAFENLPGAVKSTGQRLAYGRHR
jgi:hypothetical protein